MPQDLDKTADNKEQNYVNVDIWQLLTDLLYKHSNDKE